jgi:hypothetical protein
MTIIAYRDGVLAADTAAHNGATRICGVTKIARREDGVLAGASGGPDFMGEFLRWVRGEKSERPTPIKDSDGTDMGALFFPDGRIEIYESNGMFEITPGYYAMGSGRDQALGAMFLGAGAVQAVRAAIAHDAYCGGEITVLRHHHADFVAADSVPELHGSKQGQCG